MAITTDNAEFAPLILKNGIYSVGAKPIGPGIGGESTARHLQRAPVDGSYPKIAITIFSQCMYSLANQAVGSHVSQKLLVTLAGCWKKLTQSLTCGDPQLPIGRLKQTVDPTIHQPISCSVRASDNRAALVRL